MPNKELDDEVDPLAEGEEIVDAADEDDDEFEDEDVEDDEDAEDEEDIEDIEARGSLTREVGSEGDSPGEVMEIFRAPSGNSRGGESSETMPGGTRARIGERRDTDAG